jgi:hypothetical protein
MAAVASLGYALLAFQNDLIFRRVGFVEAAEAAANRPLLVLFLVRVFEVLFYPFLITRYYAWRTGGKRVPWYLVMSLVVAFLTMGTLDSRIKILTPALVFLVFIALPRQGWGIRPESLLLPSLAVLGLLGVVLAERVRVFGSVSQMVVQDVLRRLNGFDLLGRLEQAGSLSLFGSWDFDMFRPLSAGIPWLASTAELKATGMTSTKTYLLNDVLNLGEFDALSPLVVDPIYFGGAPLLVFVMTGIGFIAARFDYAARRGTWQKSAVIASVFIAVGLASLRFEESLASTVFNVVRDSIIVWVMLRTIVLWPRREVPAWPASEALVWPRTRTHAGSDFT